MIRSLDHIVILVHDLEQAIADYSTLGFNVVRGGQHPGGSTHNALVAFHDGAYLELIAYLQPDPSQRWWQLGQRGGEGLIDYALLPSDTAQVVADARARGLELQGPIDGGRDRPDGQRLKWQTARAATADLPFLCGDITPRALRVPEGAAQQHANGALGVARLTVVVTDMDTSVARYRALLGDDATINDSATSIDTTATIQLGATQITLRSPVGDPDAAALREQLAVRGEGPYALALIGAADSQLGALDMTLAHGARLELVSC